VGVAKALRLAGGILSDAARALGMERSALSKRVTRNPSLQAVQAECAEVMLDKAEYGLNKGLDGGEAWAVSLALRLKGRNRGYAMRTETTGPNGQPIELRAVDVPPRPEGPGAYAEWLAAHVGGAAAPAHAEGEDDGD
jgi:hypothetical protein